MYGARAPITASTSDIAQPTAFKNACLACHDEDVIGQQHLTRAQWEREIQKMIDWGAGMRDEDREGFLDYLFSNYGAGLRARGPK